MASIAIADAAETASTAGKVVPIDDEHVPFAIGQVAMLLYDEFPFYRGLVGEAIR